MARVSHTAKAMKGEGSPSNRNDQPAPSEVAKAAAAWPTWWREGRKWR
jgi:hypothetical protein